MSASGKENQRQTAFWAFVDKIPLETARAAVCAAARVDGNKLETVTHEQYNLAVCFLERVIYHVSIGGDLATAEQKEIIQAMLEACAQFRFTLDQNFTEIALRACNISIEEFSSLSRQGAGKFIICLWGIFNQSLRYTKEWNDAYEWAINAKKARIDSFKEK